MASEKNINTKKAIVEEIKNKIDASESVILFTYQGLTVSDLSTLRIKLKIKDFLFYTFIFFIKFFL